MKNIFILVTLLGVCAAYSITGMSESANKVAVSPLTVLKANSLELPVASAGGCPATVKDVDGNVYNTVSIHKQCWMKENLKTTRYRDGSGILNANANLTWARNDSANIHTGAYCDYGGNTANDTTYGKLYNWYAVSDSRKICPAGWHVPDDAEFKQLASYLGEELAGAKIKSVTLWAAPNAGADNSSGFTALPAGYRSNYGRFTDLGKLAYFWSSTGNTSADAWLRIASYDDMDIDRGNIGKGNGLSVRCVKD